MLHKYVELKNSPSSTSALQLFHTYCYFYLTEKPTKAPSLSRGVIVGICGGITLLLCLSLGAILVCRHTWKQRKLRMEFEDDLESKGKR